jgi:DNA-binding response OmpR family regulator
MDGARAAPSVVVVEDDQAVVAYLADNLAADGFKVACARGAAEALRAIEVRGPDLVLLET